ncbi:MAG: tetratricopeptide repeat protein [Candidatus Aenigmarchaeota archaeon]|nr:tetratricopeptide repeat protein [Candidatus Aenigmarchaeota archaeon]
MELSILIDNENCPQLKSYCLGNTVNITNKMENIGSFNLTGNLSTSIFNTTNQEIHKNDWSNIDLLVGEIQYRNTNYTIQEKDEPGIYSIKSNFTYDGNLTESKCNFRVNKGIGTLRRVVSLPFPPDQIVDEIQPGRTEIYPSGILLWLESACNGTIATINKTKGIPGDWVSFSQDKVSLTLPNFFNSTDVNITVPPFTPEGVYDNGTIFVSAHNPYGNDPIREIKLNITVSYAYFKLNVTIPEESKTICDGGSVNAKINITKVYPPEDVNVSITYQILDYNRIVYDEKKDNILIIKNETIFPFTMNAPSSTGKYTFLVKLERNWTVAQAYDTFEVVSCPTTTEIPGGGGGGGRREEIKKLETYKIILNVSDEILTVITGNKTSFIASVNNTGTEIARSIKILVDGIPSEWITFFPLINNIYPGEIGKYLVVIEVPTNTKTGIYELNVKAKDGMESNTVVITLVIGRDPKEIADLLLTELEKVKAEARNSLMVKDCIDITIIKTIYDDAEYAVEKGKEEYDKKNYEEAINWFEYAIPIEKKVVDKVDITLKMELETSNTSRVLIPPFFKSNEQFQLAGEYLEEKNYEKICNPLEKIKKFILIGLIFWPGMVVILIILVIIFMIYYRIRRRRERTRILLEVKERLKKIPPPVEGQA